MGDRRPSNKPTCSREETANEALEVFKRAGARSVVILATWSKPDELGRVDLFAGAEPGLAWSHGRDLVGRYLSSN